MHKIFLALILSCLPIVALASNLVHSTPSAGYELIVSGAPGSFANVCYTPATSPGPSPDVEVVCEDVELFGAMNPVSLSVALDTPVRVQGARWAYTRDLDGNVTPLQSYEVE
jgi:hypothetical protein